MHFRTYYDSTKDNLNIYREEYLLGKDLSIKDGHECILRYVHDTDTLDAYIDNLLMREYQGIEIKDEIRIFRREYS